MKPIVSTARAGLTMDCFRDQSVGMPRKTKSDDAQRAWELIFDYLMSTAPARSRALGKRGLTPNDARALWSLSDDRGTPIGALAKAWECDPSNATFIVDRLVRAGYARREESMSDRRVKLVKLTREGTGAKVELIADYLSVPSDLARLRQSDLKALITIFEKLDHASSSVKVP